MEQERAIQNVDPADTENMCTDYTTLLNRTAIYIAICVLFGVLCAVLSILTTRSVASSDGGIIYAFFVSVLIVAVTVKYFKAFGIITALISSALFCIALKTSFVDGIINVGVNVLQATLIFVAFIIINKFGAKDRDKKENKAYKNIFAILQITIGIVFTCIQFALQDTVVYLRIITVIEVALFLCFCIIQKRIGYLLYILILCMLPSMISGVLNGCMQFGRSWAYRLNSMEVWTLSNFILLSSFGYFFIVHIHPDRINKKLTYGEINIKTTSFVYYVAALLWNSVFFVIYLLGWLGQSLLPFLLPWIVGNMFLLLNLYFNSNVEVDEKNGDAFKWYENRAIVAEKNTQFLISIITFLLPISSSLFSKNLSIGIITIFCINITCACLSIGLIWIPNKEVKAMSLIKTLKTVFHLLTVSFLLLSATMIIVPN